MRRRHGGGHRPSYIRGDFLRVCDLSGTVVRASDTVKLWNGLIVRSDWHEARNPQDFVRGVPDNQRVPEPRPEKADVFLTANQVTADDL
jgi:hypothetical protein